MSSWNFINIGASADPDNIRLVRKIFEYFGIAEKPAWSASGYDKCSFSLPEVYGCSSSEYEKETGKCRVAYNGFVEDHLMSLLNALFPGTLVYVHSSEGDTVSDAYEFDDDIYDPRDMTRYSTTVYENHGSKGPNGTRISRARFRFREPDRHYVEEMLRVSRKDGNAVLAELLESLLQKLKEGTIIFTDDPSDEREINKKYDIREDGNLAALGKKNGRKIDESQYIDSVMIKKLPHKRFLELYKISTDSRITAYEEYRLFLEVLLICHSGKRGRTLNIPYNEFVAHLKTNHCKTALKMKEYNDVKDQVVRLFSDQE